MLFQLVRSISKRASKSVRVDISGYFRIGYWVMWVYSLPYIYCSFYHLFQRIILEVFRTGCNRKCFYIKKYAIYGCI